MSRIWDGLDQEFYMGIVWLNKEARYTTCASLNILQFIDVFWAKLMEINRVPIKEIMALNN